MASMSSFFINDKKSLIANKASIIQGNKYRFTVLTNRLIRLEYSENGKFEDRATQNVIFRNFEPIQFSVTETEALLEIKTEYLTLAYVKNKPFVGGKIATGNTLKVNLNGTDKEWYYGNPEVRNFGGINYSLDNFEGNLKLNKGLYSMDGFTAIDDSLSLVLNDDDNFIERENKETDVYLFVYKKDFGQCLKDYYMLTGYPSFIPRYALGNWWYKNDMYTTNSVIELINKFEDNNIPLSIMTLGDKWHNNKNNYLFDATYLDPMVIKQFLNEKKIVLGLKVDPELGVSSEDNMYKQLTQYLGNYKNLSFFPLDMTRLALYFNAYIKPLQSLGVDFFSIGYNKIEDLRNLWLLNHYHYTEIATLKNVRGLILSRNCGKAPHRYPVIYTGRTKASWETLNALPYYNLSASNIGVSFIAHALGGYHGGVEVDELYLRYIQFGTFSPIFLLASDGGKYYKREPWRWNERNLGVIREYMQLRHKLIPYLYTESYIYHKTGAPLIQPFYYKYPQIYDEPLYKNQYFLGSEMFIAPITKHKNYIMNRVVQRVFVPDGMWFDYKSGRKYPGNKYYMNFYKNEDYPVFCKAGTILPLSLDKGTNPPVNIELQVFPEASNVYNLYEDDGITYNYKNGNYLITNYEFKYEKDNYMLSIRYLEGTCSAIPERRNYKIRFRNTRSCHTIVYVNGSPVQVKTYTLKNDFVIEIEGVPFNANVGVNCTGQDIEIDAVNLINDDIANIIDDLEIETTLKEKADAIMFSSLPIKKKRIEIRKLRKFKLEPKFVNLFLKLLEYLSEV